MSSQLLNKGPLLAAVLSHTLYHCRRPLAPGISKPARAARTLRHADPRGGHLHLAHGWQSAWYRSECLPVAGLDAGQLALGHLHGDGGHKLIGARRHSPHLPSHVCQITKSRRNFLSTSKSQSRRSVLTGLWCGLRFRSPTRIIADHGPIVSGGVNPRKSGEEGTWARTRTRLTGPSSVVVQNGRFGWLGSG